MQSVLFLGKKPDLVENGPVIKRVCAHLTDYKRNRVPMNSNIYELFIKILTVLEWPYEQKYIK